MARRVKSRERIVQKTVGFRRRHHDFFDWCEENGLKFRPDEHARKAVDEQIKLFAETINEEANQFLQEE